VQRGDATSILWAKRGNVELVVSQGGSPTSGTVIVKVPISRGYHWVLYAQRGAPVWAARKRDLDSAKKRGNVSAAARKDDPSRLSDTDQS